MRIQNDEPAAIDRLGREHYARAFARLASSCDTPLVVGLYGGWGVGKTSLMRQIQRELDPSRTRCIWFDPWRHQFDDTPALALLHTVSDALSLGSDAKKYLTVIASAFSSVLLKATTSMSLDDVDSIGKRYEEERYLIREARVRLQQYFQKIIEKAQEDGRYQLVFFIDDLDRCMPRQVLDLLEALKLYLNLRGCVYFLGVDRQALERSINHCYANLELSETSYLDKIVQLPFTIPPVPQKKVRDYILSLIPSELHQCTDLLAVGLQENPREIKRFINTLMLNHELALSVNVPEYEPRTLALLLLIQQRSSLLYGRILRDGAYLAELAPGSEGWREHISGDERLQSALNVYRPRQGALLRPYLYLTEVAGITSASQSGTGRHWEMPTDISLDVQDQLEAHDLWLRSGGLEGQRGNLPGVRLNGRDLRRIFLPEVQMPKADFQQSSLVQAVFERSNLSGANFRLAILRSTSFAGAELCDADFSHAKLDQADFRGANLTGARGLQAGDLTTALTDEKTLLPDGTSGPFRPGKGSHHPKGSKPARRLRRSAS